MIGLVTFIIIFMLYVYDVSKKDKLSSNLAKSYSIAFLYSGNTPYSLSLQNDNSTSSSEASDSSLYSSQFQSLNSDSSSNSILNYNSTSGSKDNSSDSFVIGIIKIDKIALNYPIISETNEELLKISVCKFAGPMPNEIGNLCIAGHNYIDNKFFSRLNELSVGDIIEIYDLSGSKINYTIFQKQIVDSTDLTCTNQNVMGQKQITLITCSNTNNSKRLIIKAKNKKT